MVNLRATSHFWSSLVAHLNLLITVAYEIILSITGFVFTLKKYVLLYSFHVMTASMSTGRSGERSLIY